MNAAALHDAIAAVCPISGVSIVDEADKTTWRIDFAAEATDAQKQSAAGVIAKFDPNAKPPPSCQLWQLQSVMSAAQWSAAQTAVAALNNSAVNAFWAHGTNVIPADSKTLIALGAAIGLSADQVTALVAQAAAVSIP